MLIPDLVSNMICASVLISFGLVQIAPAYLDGITKREGLFGFSGICPGMNDVVPGNDPEPGDLLFEIVGQLPGARENCRCDHDLTEHDRDLQNGCDDGIRSGPLITSRAMPRAFAIKIASASARCGRGPQVQCMMANENAQGSGGAEPGTP